VPEGEWRSIVPVGVITDPLRAAAVLLYRRGSERSEALASLHHEIARLENEQQHQMLEADLATGRFGRVLRGLRPETALEEPEAIFGA
jgi:hypothetical protein